MEEERKGQGSKVHSVGHHREGTGPRVPNLAAPSGRFSPACALLLHDGQKA
jgi:hypothetical protein